MADTLLVLITLASLGGAIAAFGLALRHHWHIVVHDSSTPESRRAE